MKNIFLFIISIFFLSISVSAQTTIKGTVLGSDGKPMKMAHISIYKATDVKTRVTTEVAKDGSYTLNINEKGPYFLNVLGLNHQGESVLLATEDFLNETIDITLEPKKYVKSKMVNKIMGDFNGFDALKGIEMKMMPDSTFTAVIETKQDKIKFVIIVGSISGSNGTQEEAEYEFDARRGIYLTVLKAVDGKVEVNFDPAKLPQSEAKSTIKFGKESIVSKVAKLYWDYNSFSQEYINAFINTMLNNKKNTFDFDEPIKKFDELYINESNQFVKQIIVLLQAQLASLSQSKDDFKEKIANRLIEEIKLDSYLLNFNPGQWIGTVFEPRKKEIANEAARRGFVDKYIELSTISKEEKVKLVLSLLQGAKAAYNEPLRKKYFDLIMSKYADTESAKKAKEFSDEFQLVVGSPIPKFSLVSHDDPKITFTNDSFKGKIYMIDFWATWCGPCKAEMPELHKVYEKFKNKGFEILSISFDQTADAIDKYRKGEWKMPWLHAFVDGEIKAKLQKDFDAMAIPKPFLVDGNTGRILALTTDLRGENLEKTIEKFLK